MCSFSYQGWLGGFQYLPIMNNAETPLTHVHYLRESIASWEVRAVYSSGEHKTATLWEWKERISKCITTRQWLVINYTASRSSVPMLYEVLTNKCEVYVRLNKGNSE